MKRYIFSACFSTCLAIGTLPAQAVEWPDRIKISGFGSAVYQITNEDDRDVLFYGDTDESGVNKDGSFRGTRIGLNVTAVLTDRINFMTQMLASDEESNYDARIDWGFVSYLVNDNATVRAGKIKFPVGLVNEYVDVGYAYPWITPPQVIYSEQGPEGMGMINGATTILAGGPQATREAYTGASLLLNTLQGEWTLGADLFAGEVNLDGMKIKQLGGITARAEYSDLVLFQASYYTGEMRPNNAAAPPGALMDGKSHEATLFGIKVDWNNFIVYAEMADVDMEDLPGLDADTWYATAGYQIGRFLPHFTYQDLETSDGDEQQILTLGLKVHLADNLVGKMEVSRIETDQGAGLFNDSPTDDSVNMFGIAVDVIF